MRVVTWLVVFTLAVTTHLLAQAPVPDPHEGHDAARTDHVDPEPLVPVTREVSGTAWQPDTSPMYALHTTAGPWRLMLHGAAYGHVLAESGADHHGGRQAGSINWFMGMAQRDMGRGRLGLRGMVSLEPWTIGGCGYPDLLATGEICDGDSIHDRQHPHDALMEIAATYDRPLTPTARWQLYGGVAAEPALGPVAFPHRLSALTNPIAPIAHHWLDATHISFGVVTAAVYTRGWKVEWSQFNGREPDEDRTNIDFAPLDSFSARFSAAPTAGLAFQVSAGHLRESEAGLGAQSRADKNRFTTSMTYHRGSSDGRFWATTFAYGANAGRHVEAGGAVDQTTHAALGETTLLWRDRDALFGRIEVVTKPAHELHAHELEPRILTVGKLQAGYVRYFMRWKGLVAGVGGSVSMSLLPPDLAPRYEGEVAPGVGLFVTIRPAAMRIGAGHLH